MLVVLGGGRVPPGLCPSTHPGKGGGGGQGKVGSELMGVWRTFPHISQGHPPTHPKSHTYPLKINEHLP